MELEGLEPQQVESSRQLHQKKVLMERVILRLSLLSSKNAPSWSGGFGIRPWQHACRASGQDGSSDQMPFHAAIRSAI